MIGSKSLNETHVSDAQHGYVCVNKFIQFG